jgi:hypothetical protein
MNRGNPSRLAKVQKFWAKKRQKKQYVYKSRQKNAAQKLRINGKFVTNDQAFKILGINKEMLLNNEDVQEMLKVYQMNKMHNEEIQINS